MEKFKLLQKVESSFSFQATIHLTAKLPSGEDVLAIKREKMKEDEIILFVGQLLSPL